MDSTEGDRLMLKPQISHCLQKASHFRGFNFDLNL